MIAVWQWLDSAGAQRDAVDWARPFGDDIARWWAECPRGDWLLAIAARLGCERRALVQAAAACARLALDLLPEAEQRPAAALSQLEAYCRGEVDAAACEPYRAALDAAIGAALDPIAGTAASAALAAMDAVRDPDAASAAVAFACQAAVMDAGDCAMEQVLRYTQVTSAERVREALPAEVVAAAYAVVVVGAN